MKKIVFLLIVGLFLSSMAYAGGSIFGKKHKESNEDGVYSIRVFICNTLNCPDVVMYPADCEKVPHSTLQYGVCMCDSGYVMKNGQCVVDSSANCNVISSCNTGYFCNFGGEGTPNVCQKIKAETFEYNGVTYYYNKRVDLASWCRSTPENANDCAYGYLTYYGAYDWCSMQGARLLKSEEVPTLAQQWLKKLPWDGNLTAYWLDDGRVLTDGSVVSLGDTTGWEGAGGVVCVKDNTALSSVSADGTIQWMNIEGCSCTDNGVSTDTSDEVCNIQCCRNKYGEKGYAVKGRCCPKDDDDCICAANGCKTGGNATPLDDFCCAKAQGLI